MAGIPSPPGPNQKMVFATFAFICFATLTEIRCHELDFYDHELDRYEVERLWYLPIKSQITQYELDADFTLDDKLKMISRLLMPIAVAIKKYLLYLVTFCQLVICCTNTL